MSVDWGSPRLKYTTSVELIDDSGRTDVTDDVDLKASTLRYRNGPDQGVNALATLSLHHMERIVPNSIVGLRVRVTDNMGGTESWEIGHYLVDAPERRLPLCDGRTIRVICDDITVVLDRAVGYSWVATKGSSVVAEAARAVAEADPSLIIAVMGDTEEMLPETWAWLIAQESTWRCVADQLLLRGGYRSLWMDRDGELISDQQTDAFARFQALENPIHLDVNDPKTLVGIGLQIASDLKGWPNQWKIINKELALVFSASTIPGQVEVRDNINEGPASQEAIGRVVPKILKVDVTSNDALSRIADEVSSAQIYPTETVGLMMIPRPDMWHDDVAAVSIQEEGWSRVPCEVLEWEYDLAFKDLAPVSLRRLR